MTNTADTNARRDSPTSTNELDHVRGEIRAEIELLNSRLNALISSQSFLFIAYGTALGVGFDHWRNIFTLTLPPVLALLGVLLTFEARPGIQAAQEAIGHWRARENQMIDTWPELSPFTLATNAEGRRRMELRQHAGKRFATRAPLILLAAWSIFLVLPFALYFTS